MCTPHQSCGAGLCGPGLPLAAGVGSGDGPRGGHCPSRRDKEASNHQGGCAQTHRSWRARTQPALPFPMLRVPLRPCKMFPLSGGKKCTLPSFQSCISWAEGDNCLAGGSEIQTSPPRQRSWNDGLPKSTLRSPLSFTGTKSSWKEWFASVIIAAPR